jgi:hypothetical protein
LVREPRADRLAQGFNSWEQFVANTVCQLGRTHPSRDLLRGLFA